MTQIELKAGEVSMHELQRVTDVITTALHVSFSDRVLDGRALSLALTAMALGVLRDLRIEDPKELLKGIVHEFELSRIAEFAPVRVAAAAAAASPGPAAGSPRRP